MILFIDLEHKALGESKPEYYSYVQEKRRRTAHVFEELSGEACRLVYFCDDRLLGLAQTASLIIISGHNSGYEHYTDEELSSVRCILAEPPCPTFTICGSFQLMVQVHGGEIGPIGECVEGQRADADPILPRSMIQENGFVAIEKLDTAIQPFQFMPTVAHMQEHHYWEVKQLPESFISCARSQVCQQQAIVHRSLPLAGVQFHPEEFTADQSDGRDLLLAVIDWARGGKR